MIFFLYLLLLSISFTQNFSYDEEDWLTLSNPGLITSITTSRDEIIFSSENGIFLYDNYSSELLFLDDYVRNFNYKNCYIVHYDDARDYLWLLNEDNLAFKPYTSSFWREIDFYELKLATHKNILNIGSNEDFIFINLGSEILVLNPYTGQLIDDQLNEYSNIKWTSTYRNILSHNYDLTNFHSFEGYNFISNQVIEYKGMNIYISAIARYGNDLWIGTNSGEIFLCDLHLKTVEKIKSMPFFSDINITYLDKLSEWWFSTNDFVFLNNQVFLGNNQIFLIRWIEEQNKWISYSQNKYLNIRSSDITSIYRYDNFLYIGTKFGLLIFDIDNEEWTLIDKEKNLIGEYIYDIEFYNEKLYIATSLGLNVFSIDGNFVIKNKFKQLHNKSIYDIIFVEDRLFLISDLGLYEYNLNLSDGKLLYDDKFTKLLKDDSGSLMLVKKNRIFKYEDNNRSLLLNIKKIQDASYCDKYIWINHGKKASLFDIKNDELFEYDSNDGISGSKINDLGCDDSWVWFSTNKGMSIYNWRKYHSNEK